MTIIAVHIFGITTTFYPMFYLLPFSRYPLSNTWRPRHVCPLPPPGEIGDIRNYVQTVHIKIIINNIALDFHACSNLLLSSCTSRNSSQLWSLSYRNFCHSSPQNKNIARERKCIRESTIARRGERGASGGSGSSSSRHGAQRNRALAYGGPRKYTCIEPKYGVLTKLMKNDPCAARAPIVWF
jgi:hypothetical protein